MSFETISLSIAALVVLGILLHHPSKTLGIPSLLIFMAVGLVFGNGELGFVYDNLSLTSLVGGIALNIIVFVGGLNTSTANIKIAWKEGGVLSSLGVLLTCCFFAVILYWQLDFDFLTCMLFAAVVASTDAAAVFSILESKRLKLKESTGTVLEVESATNDPIALILVIMLTELIVNSNGVTPTLFEMGQTLVEQVFFGACIGYVIGKLCVESLNFIKLQEYGLIPVYILATFVITSYSTELVGGNVLIAVYIAGVLIGNDLNRGKEVNKHFYNGLSWLAQSLMFVVIGLQMFPKQLMEVFAASLIPGLLLILLARPLAVHICFLPFRKASWSKRWFISFIGLKGATPIIFALIPAAAGVPGAVVMLHMVFFIVLLSVVIQGGIIEPLAKLLNLNQPDEPS